LLPVLPPEKAQTWSKELFTRIILDRFEAATPETLNFVVSFEPMRSSYIDKNQFKSLVLPIIQEEWNFGSRQYAMNNTAMGEIEKVELIEDFVNEEDSSITHSFAVTVIMPTDHFWNTKCVITARKLSLAVSCTNKVKSVKNYFFKIHYSCIYITYCIIVA